MAANLPMQLTAAETADIGKAIAAIERRILERYGSDGREANVRRELAFAFAHAAARMGLDLGAFDPRRFVTGTVIEDGAGEIVTGSPCSIHVEIRGIGNPIISELARTEILIRLDESMVNFERGVDAVAMGAIRDALESVTDGSYCLSGVVHASADAPYIVYADPVLKP